MIKVYVWIGHSLPTLLSAQLKKRSDVVWGHASMEVFDGLPAGRKYMSWWPMAAVYNDLRADPDRSHEVAHINPDDLGVFRGTPYTPKSLAEDTALEGGKPPIVVTLKGGLDETAIKAWWRRRLADKNALYMATGGNCSTSVYLGLIAGGSYEYTPWYYTDRPWFTDTPPDPETTRYPVVLPSTVLDYARVVEKELNEAGWDDAKRYALVGKMADASLRKAVKDALDDNGKLSLAEVKLICQAALDKGGVSRQEVRDLKRVYRLSKTMGDDARQYLRQFIKKHG